MYVVSITPSGTASLITYNSNVVPPTTYPALPSSGLVSAACTVNSPASLQVNVGVNGAVIPTGINTNETVYSFVMPRRIPITIGPTTTMWERDNGARLPSSQFSLSGKMHPDQVWPGIRRNMGEGTVGPNGDFNWSGLALGDDGRALCYRRNKPPYHLMTTVNWTASDPGLGHQHILSLRAANLQVIRFCLAMRMTDRPDRERAAGQLFSWIHQSTDGASLVAV